ncbi:xanthine dehydrogenase family protein molybdopterin-binding subunit [Dyella solisilvae]|uniref:Xanthine dehydrogenase family protein molybdopterin-binding subunit n=1 Tax=Dyella solisilvae TaxID=1920168 RepID=A0A370K6H8_9GAMM|nr:molybdopterin cofactor-binding domain-containing protein [Dyella solisilvae]RDI97620.1 xanthine dehydrogenase family protein molybdopterin-binding subunit [Dyella solisilvae]
MSARHESSLPLSRRRFLKVFAGAAGALIVGIPLAEAVDAPVPAALLGDTLYGLGAFVRIDPDGNIIIGARDPDTGTGTTTTLPRIIADELDADWTSVSVVPLGLGVEDDNGSPRFVYGHQNGGLGTSVPAAWADLREAGAVARWLLLQAAARRLGVPADRLRCEEGNVIAPDGRRFGYGALAEAASKIPAPSSPVPLKAPQHYTLIGQPAGDVDARAIVTGQAVYALDSYAGDSLIAVLSHCPWVDGSVQTLDTTDALAVKGVVKVVQLKPEPGVPLGQTVRAPAVAVLAENTWAALQGRAKLKLEWKPGGQSESSAWFEQQAADVVNDKDAAPTARVRNDGDVDAAGKKAAHRVEATYVQPWLAHATSEPMNCLARVDKDGATLVVPTQAPQQAWRVVQRLTGLSPSQIQIRVPRVGGGYGRRLDHDFVAEAVMLAKLAERPVKLMWTRDEDLGQDYFRSASVHKLSATLDGKRQVVTWTQRMASASALVQRGVPDNRLWTSEIDPHQLPAGLVPNLRSDWYALPSVMPRGTARGMPHLSNAFPVESFVDEIANSLKEDPLVTRLRMIGQARMIDLGDGRTLDTGRLINVLQLVADRIGWKNWLRTVNGFGIACWHVDGAYVAHAVEASLQGNRLNIERAICAVDVGRVINPMGLEGQVAGATLDALSTALNLSVTYKDSQVQQRNWKDYPLASMLQLPDTTEVILVPGDRDPAGASFLAMPTAAPALANAVFRVSAVRVRRLPLMKELLRML